MVTVSLIVLPLPTAVQLLPAEAAQLQLLTVTVFGTVSLTTAPTAALGPLLVTTIW